jgi:predicted DNA repair protein MutK
MGAVRTDFILSAEIVGISLRTVAKEEFTVQVGVLIAIAVVMTFGVYGLGRRHREARRRGSGFQPAQGRERPDTC